MAGDMVLQQLIIGLLLVGRLAGAGDQDFYVVPVAGGGASMDMVDVRACTAAATMELALFGPDGKTLVAYQRHAGCAHLRARVPAGSYQLRVRASRSVLYSVSR